MGNDKFVLSAGNYHEWRRNVLIALDKKGLRDNINLDQLPTDATAKINYAKTRGIILDGLDYAAISLTNDDDSPKAILKTFEDTFMIPNIINQGLTIRKISLIKGEIGNMQSYITQMTKCFEELKANGLDLPETYRCVAICANMPEKLDEVWNKCEKMVK